MKKLLLLGLLLLTTQCDARTFGCFMGVLVAGSEKKVEVDYMHYRLFSVTKSTEELLPFAGCGVSFDF